MNTVESVDEYNQAKICDFGLSHIIDTKTGKATAELKCGTIGYMAPEISTVINLLKLIDINRVNKLDQKWICGVSALCFMSWLLHTNQHKFKTIVMV